MGNINGIPLVTVKEFPAAGFFGETVRVIDLNFNPGGCRQTRVTGRLPVPESLFLFRMRPCVPTATGKSSQVHEGQGGLNLHRVWHLCHSVCSFMQAWLHGPQSVAPRPLTD